MTSHRRFEPRRPDRAGEGSGVYEINPLEELADRIHELEQAKRRVLASFEDVVAWGGTANTTGYTRGEWMALVGRLPGRDTWQYELLVSRLPALPVTAVLLETGQLTIDQAISIASGTKRLNGDLLAEVEREAAHVALSRNERGDDPDMDADVDAIVQSRKKAADQDRLDRDRLERNSVRIQPDLWGAGRIVEDWADPEGFQTRVAGLEHAAGQPTPDVPRGQQLAEGSLAMSRSWLAGHRTTGAVADVDAEDVDTTTLDALDHPELPGPGLGAARPTFVVRIDIADLDGFDPSDPDALRHLATGSNAAMGRLAARGRLSSTPWLGRQLLDTLACNVDLLVSVVDGERPLAEFRHTRRLPDRIRRQVLWRDMGCRWPSCRAPVAHCDVHHLDENPTNHDVDNLLTLCRRHHRRLHSVFWHPYLDGSTGRFELRRSPDGHAVHTTYPRGTRPTAQPPPEIARTR